VRDFRGLNPKSFDGRGNYALGLKEHIIFVEIDYGTRPRRCGAWTSSSTPLRSPTMKPRRFSRASSFPHELTARRYGEAFPDQSQQEAREDGGPIRRPAPAALKATAKDPAVPEEEQFAARLKLAKLPRNSAKVRVKHRCELSGRSKGFYRKVKLSRIALRDLANFGQIPGMTKASW